MLGRRILEVIAPFVQYISVGDSGRIPFWKCQNSITIKESKHGGFSISIVNNDVAYKLRIGLNLITGDLSAEDNTNEEDWQYEATRTLMANGPGAIRKDLQPDAYEKYYAILVSVLELEENVRAIRETFNLASIL